MNYLINPHRSLEKLRIKCLRFSVVYRKRITKNSYSFLRILCYSPKLYRKNFWPLANFHTVDL